jgi:hypothetical protein
MTVKDKIILNIWERKLFRRIHGPEPEQEFGESSNQQLKEVNKISDSIADQIRVESCKQNLSVKSG